MSRLQISTDQAPRPAGAYSQGIVANGFLYTAGLGPQDPVTGAVVGDTAAEQTRQVMRNLLAVLAAHGLNASHLVKTTVHLQDLARDFPSYNEAYQEFLVQPFPVRTTVGSTLNGILVEIDAVALAPMS